MRVYILRHKYANATFIRLFRVGKEEKDVGFRTHLFMSLSNILTKTAYSNGRYLVLYKFLKQHKLFKDAHKEPGDWLDDWEYEMVFRARTIEELRENTEEIIKRALEGDAFLLNSSLPWNRGTVLRDKDGRWVGVVRPHAYLERLCPKRRADLRKSKVLLDISKREPSLDTSIDFDIPGHDVGSTPIKKPQKPLNPFMRVFGS